MEKDNRVIKFINSPIPAGIIATAIFTCMQKLFKKGFPLMVEPFSFYNVITTGIISLIGSYVIYTYYFQKKEIKNIKDETCNISNEIETKFNYVLNKICHETANMYKNFSYFSNNSPHDQLFYLRMALEQYIECNNQTMIKQLLNETRLMIQSMRDRCLLSASSINVPELRELVGGIDQKLFGTEIVPIIKTLNELR